MSAPYHNKALPEGALLREWRLEQVLGVGGFGIVYRGRGLYFDEVVAIKEYFPSAISDRLDDTTVAPNDSTSEEIYALGLQKFLEEAKVLWNLSKPERHPNIVSVRSLFEINGTAYMVMDFETGVSLSRLMKEGRRFDEASLLAIIRPVAEGLERAHRAGVLHRDIKPANILVDDEGRSVLIDFGSARFDAGQATSTKVTFYTPPYAAIEQYVKTYPQGPWTDIYALGVTLYECVSGAKPPEVLERLHGGLGEALSSREWPGFSARFTRAVDAAMAPKPSDRPQSIGQWLRMFDADARIDDEDATRIAVVSQPPHAQPSPPTVSPPPAATTPPPAPEAAVAGANTRAPAETDASSGAATGSRTRPTRPMIAAGVGAVVLAGAAAIWATQAPRASHPAPPPSARALTTARVVARAPLPPSAGPIVASPIVPEAAALAAEAQRAGRPRKETAALNSARDEIAELNGKISALGARPDAAAAASALSAEMNRRALDVATAEGGALNKDADALVKPVLHNPGWMSGALSTGAAGEAINAVKKARAGLKSDFAALERAQDGAGKLAAARVELTAFNALGDAYVSAKPAFVALERQKYQSLDASARQTYAEIVRLAGGPKPWIFAPRAEKDAYRLSQETAAKAKARLGELDALYQTARGSGDLDQLSAAALQVTSIQADLARLKAAMSITPRKLSAEGSAGVSKP